MLQPERPNIVLILVDDMGFSDIGSFGSEIRTPYLDTLASEGLRLTHMYNGARCCPTRASLLTGLYPHQAGIGHMVTNLGFPGYQGFLNDHCLTIAEALRQEEYRTLMSGKWHVGGQYSLRQGEWEAGQPGFPTPLQRGFDRFFGTLAGAGSYYNPHTLMEQETFIKPDSDEFYYTEVIGQRAAAMIDGSVSEHKPFFLYLAFTAPHWPLHAPESVIDTYRERYLCGWDRLREERFHQLRTLGVIRDTWQLSPRDPVAPPWTELSPDRQCWEADRMAVYAAQIECMDHAVGTVIQTLDRHRILDNTLIIFLSDNGGCAEFLREDAPNSSAPPYTRDGKPVRIGNIPDLRPGPADTYMSYDLPWANASNTPFRRYKHWVHEGGIATPCIVSWPRVIPRNTTSHAACHIIDIFPTILEAASLTYPHTTAHGAPLPLEGESWLPLLQGNAQWRRSHPLFWEHEGNCAVRSERWKLVRKSGDPWELYNIEEDRTELHDLADRHPQVVGELSSRYEEWAERCGVIPWEELRLQLASRKG
ncbi:MAG: arylsulfatase [Chloroflexi bacterium]|nr:arylsulfatase [Chloroflexota bacterium]